MISESHPFPGGFRFVPILEMQWKMVYNEKKDRRLKCTNLFPSAS